jgi:hypothetical protein
MTALLRAGLLAVVVFGSACSEPAEPTTGAAEHLRLARDGVLHFVLEPEVLRLTLFHGPAPLRSWEVESVEAGPRRLAAWGDIERSWHTKVWSTPRLDPPVRIERRVIESDSVVPPDLSGAEEWIPPTPEEAVPTPARFVAHFDGGLGLEVIAVGEGAPSRGLLHGAARAFGAPELRGDRFRVRVTLEAGEAGALYRSFPPDAALVIIKSSDVTNGK